MNALFELRSSEITALSAAFEAIPRREVVGDCVWLRVTDTYRSWTVTTERSRFEFRVHEAHEATTDGWLPVSDRIVAFARMADDDPVMLSVAEGAVVADTPTRSAAIDLVNTDGSPYGDFEGDVEATVTVSLAEFAHVLFSARSMPSGAGDLEWLSPPMWMQVGDGRLALHVDWGDVALTRSTFRIEARSHGDAVTVAIPHATFGLFLEHLPTGGDDLVITIGHDTDLDTRWVRLQAGEWRLAAKAVDPLLERWENKLDELFLDDPFSVVGQRGTDYLVCTEGCEVEVSLSHGHPDTARVTAVLVQQVSDSPELLRELNALNVAAANVRFFWADGTVRAAIEVRLSEFDGLGPAVTEVALAARRYGSLLAVYADSESAA